MTKFAAEYPFRSKSEYTLTFYSLVFFTFILYISPQEEYPFLQPLHLARVSAIIAISAYVFQRRPLLDLDFDTKCLLFIVFFAILSIPFSIWTGGSYDVFASLFIKAVIIFFIIANTINSLERLKQIMWYMVGFCAFLAFFTINQFFAKGFLRGTTRVIGSASGIAANPNDIALTMALIVPLSLSLFMATKKRMGKILCLAYIFSSTIAIFVTYSRAGFLILVTVFSVFFFKELKRNAIKAIVISGILFIVFVSFLPQGYSSRLASILDPSLDPTGSAQARKAAMIASIPLMLENPVFGIGIGMSPIALHERGLQWTAVHSVYLQFGVEVGIPALILFILFHYSLLKNMRMIQRSSSGYPEESEFVIFARGLEASLLGFAVAAIFFPVAYHFYFYYLASFAVALKKIHLPFKNNSYSPM